jgi:DNA segregation ATPase FtsK/SpoIIIE-like protein
MYEASQEIFPSEETEVQAKARRKDQIGARKRPLAPSAAPASREGSSLLCDSWQLSNKQRLLSGFVGMAFLVPYTSLCLTYPEWTGHVGQRLSLAFFSFLGQGALVMPFLLAYLVLSCAGLRPLRKTRYGFSLPLLVSLILLVERSFHTGGWLGRTLDTAMVMAVGPGGAWLFTCTLVVLVSLAFFPKAWGEMVQGVDLAQEHLRELLLRWKERWSNPEAGAQLEPAPGGSASFRGQPPTNNGFATRDLVGYPAQPQVGMMVAKTHPFLSVDQSLEHHEPSEPSDEHDFPGAALADIQPEFVSDEPVASAEIPPPPAAPRLREEVLAEDIALFSRQEPADPASPSHIAPTRAAVENAARTCDQPRTPAQPAVFYPDAKGQESAPRPVVPPAVVRDDPYAAVPRARPFELPPLALLDDVPPSARRPRSEDKSQALLDVLDAFGVKAKLIQIVRGPTVTRYELLPARGVKVSKFTSLTNDIALALASTSVRIEAPIPGKSAIGIEIPNEVTDLVVIKDILRDSAFTDSKGLTVALGKDLSGRPVVTDLQRMPHLLVAGTTGSGKSVCVNGLILSLLYRFTPDQLQLMMVDPKQVELSVYEDIPHLVGFSEGGKGEIIVDPKKAAMALHQVVELMEQRYTLFAENRVRNLAEFNDKAETPLPWFVVIIDELADLMMVASKSVETSICRIAQKARAAGIHLVLATQRPSADVITGLIKVNIPSRCAFAVSSQVDSRVILDSGGAEHLLGKGDMLFLPVDASDPKRLQGAYVNNDEISRVVEFWKGQHLPDNRIEFELKDDPLALDEEESDEDSDDALLEEALRAILNRDQASASMLQTDLKVGYARARRLLMAMEKRGWVSAAEGSKPRKITYSGPSPGGASEA